MECPVCQYSFTFAQFCRLTNPAKILCPRCGAKLKIAGIRIISALICLAAIILSVPSIAFSDQLSEPYNYFVLAGIGLGLLFLVSYIVFKSCALDRLE